MFVVPMTRSALSALPGVAPTGVMNMGLAQVNLLAIALPLAWLECVVACWIAQECMLRFSAAARRPHGK